MAHPMANLCPPISARRGSVSHNGYETMSKLPMVIANHFQLEFDQGPFQTDIATMVIIPGGLQTLPR